MSSSGPFEGICSKIPSTGHVRERSCLHEAVCRWPTRVPPHLYFVVSAVFHYLGPAFAVLLFARVDVLGVAWLRIASAALVFALWRRPWRAFAALDRSGRRLLLAWGAVLAVMNVLLLRRDRPPAARHRRRDRVPSGDRPRGARRAHARATSPRSRSRCPACTCSPGSSSRASRSAWRSPSRTRSCSPPTSCWRTASRATAALSRDRRAGGVDADRRRGGHAHGRLGGPAGAHRPGWRCSRASASASARR